MIKEENIAITLAWDRVHAAGRKLAEAEQEVKDAVDNLIEVKRLHEEGSDKRS